MQNAKALSLTPLGFKDTGTEHPYAVDINFLKDLEIINGDEAGNFNPERSLSRCELIKTALEAVGVSPSETSEKAFSDLETDFWCNRYAFYAKNNSIVNGFPDGTFQGNSPVTEIEAHKILLNTLEVTLPEPSTDLYKNVKVGEWWTPYLQYVKDTGIEAMPTTEKYPLQDPFLRKKMARIVHRTLKLKDFQSNTWSDTIQYVHTPWNISTTFPNEYSVIVDGESLAILHPNHYSIIYILPSNDSEYNKVSQKISNGQGEGAEAQLLETTKIIAGQTFTKYTTKENFQTSEGYMGKLNGKDLSVEIVAVAPLTAKEQSDFENILSDIQYLGNATETKQVFENEQYTFEYPNNWTIQAANSESNNMVTLYNNNAPPQVINIVTNKITCPDLATCWETENKEAGYTDDMLELNIQDFQNEKAVSQVVTKTSDDLMHKQLFTYRDNTFYLLNFVANTDQYQGEVSVFDTLLESFRFK